MTPGKVLSIHTCAQAGDAMRQHNDIQALTGKGLAGDRYLTRSGTYSKTHAPDREVTLIAAETLQALQEELGYTLTPEETRRNLVTHGIALDGLYGKQIRIGGEVVLEGVRECEPCGYLEQITGKKVFDALKGRGGLRAVIVKGGTIRVGDQIEVLAEAPAQATPAPPVAG